MTIDEVGVFTWLSERFSRLCGGKQDDLAMCRLLFVSGSCAHQPRSEFLCIFMPMPAGYPLATFSTAEAEPLACKRMLRRMASFLSDAHGRFHLGGGKGKVEFSSGGNTTRRYTHQLTLGAPHASSICTCGVCPDADFIGGQSH